MHNYPVPKHAKNMHKERRPMVQPHQYQKLFAERERGEAIRSRMLILMAIEAQIDAPLAALRAFRDLIRADMLSELTDAENPQWLTNYTPWPTPIPEQVGTPLVSTNSGSDMPQACASDTKKPSSRSTERGYTIPCLTRNDFTPTEWPTPLPG